MESKSFYIAQGTLVISPNDLGYPNMIAISTAGRCTITVYLDDLTLPNTKGYPIWNIETYNLQLGDNALRYVYAKCSKKENKAYIALYPTPKSLLAETDGFYYVPIGILSAVVDNKREFTPDFGADPGDKGGLISQATDDFNQMFKLHKPIDGNLSSWYIEVLRRLSIMLLSDSEEKPSDENVPTGLTMLNTISKSIEAVKKNISNQYLRKDIKDSAAQEITFKLGLVSNDVAVFNKGITAKDKSTFDNIEVLEKLVSNILQSSDYTEGESGKGHSLTVDEKGYSKQVVDNFHARIEALFEKGITAKDKSTFDNIEVLEKLVSNILQSSDYTEGVLGKGHSLTVDEQGRSTLVVDNLHARMEAIFNKLTIAEMQSVGGQIVLSIADIQCNKVEDKGNCYRCYFDTKDGTIPNCWAINDQARCQTWIGNQKYYWRLVVGKGNDYIDLSKTDCDGSGIPEARDAIVQLGNRTDLTRQNALILSAYGTNAPSITQYERIHSYSLDGCETTVISPKGNKFTGDFSIVSGNKKIKIPADKGRFVYDESYYYYDRVSHNGALWLCIVEEGKTTKETPSDTSQAWQKQVREGGTGLRVEKFATAGYEFYRENQPYNHTLSVRVFYNEKDTTESINPLRFKWVRISENTLGDPTWNEIHSNSGNSISINNSDLAGDTSFVCQFLDIENNKILTNTF